MFRFTSLSRAETKCNVPRCCAPPQHWPAAAMAEAATSEVDGHDEEIIKALHEDGAAAPLAGASPRGAGLIIRAPTTTFSSANPLPAPSANASRTESPTVEEQTAMSAEQEAIFRRRRLTREHMDGEIESPPVHMKPSGTSWAAQTAANEALKPRQNKRVSRRISRELDEKDTVVWEVSCGHRMGTAPHRTAPHSTARHRTAPHSTAQHRTAPHSTARHRTAPHGTAQHCTALHHIRTAAALHCTSPHRASPPHHCTAQAPHTPHHRTARPRDHSPRLTALLRALGCTRSTERVCGAVCGLRRSGSSPSFPSWACLAPSPLTASSQVRPRPSNHHLALSFAVAVALAPPSPHPRSHLACCPHTNT